MAQVSVWRDPAGSARPTGDPRRAMPGHGPLAVPTLCHVAARRAKSVLDRAKAVPEGFGAGGGGPRRLGPLGPSSATARPITGWRWRDGRTRADGGGMRNLAGKWIGRRVVYLTVAGWGVALAGGIVGCDG